MTYAVAAIALLAVSAAAMLAYVVGAILGYDKGYDAAVSDGALYGTEDAP